MRCCVAATLLLPTVFHTFAATQAIHPGQMHPTCLHDFCDETSLLQVHSLIAAGRAADTKRRKPEALGDGLVKRTKVDVFYETRCPYSLDFLNTTLREAWEDKEIWNQVDVKLHPFGNAHLYDEKAISEGYHFWHPHAEYPLIVCQHDEIECLGNRIQACVIDLFQDNSSKYVPFVICMASYGLHAGIELSSYNCGQKLGVDMNLVQECTDSGRGHELVLSAGRATMTANVSHAPWLAVNGIHTKNDTLLTPVCDSISGTKPAACRSLHTKGNHSHESGKKGDCGGSGGSLIARGTDTATVLLPTRR